MKGWKQDFISTSLPDCTASIINLENLEKLNLETKKSEIFGGETKIFDEKKAQAKEMVGVWMNGVTIEELMTFKDILSRLTEN